MDSGLGRECDRSGKGTAAECELRGAGELRFAHEIDVFETDVPAVFEFQISFEYGGHEASAPDDDILEVFEAERRTAFPGDIECSS